MCGIAGAVAAQGVDRAQVEGQLRTLSHRGPDSSGVFEGSCASIGQTRLAIIDLETGDPPITNEDGTVGAVLNGEIYNFGPIRQELAAGGHRLATRCDTEVLAHLAEGLEPRQLASRLEGMFAFALWDDRRRRLVLGRDRVGKKPLFYWSEGGRLVFGSEIKAVLAHPWVPRHVDPEAFGPYLTFGCVPTPRTFFSGVLSLPPGHVLTMEPGGVPQLMPYWAPAIAGPGGPRHADLSFAEASAEVRRLLTAAVERRLVADVPLGAFLSGGVDSSAIVGIMASLGSRPVRTFTIGFEGAGSYDERAYAATVAERFGTDHTEFVARPDAVELVERLVWHHDQPFGDSSAVPTYLLSELTRAHVTVALSGDGGDELFAGYDRFGAAAALARFQRAPGPARHAARRLARRLPARDRRGIGESARRFVDAGELDLVDAYRSWVGYTTDAWRDELAGDGASWADEEYRKLWAESEGAHLLDRLTALNLRTYLLDDLLPKADRASMAHALEVRSPFLDRELLEFALRLPPRYRRIGPIGKRVLKRAVADLLPPAIVRRRKRGFGVPLDRWFRGELRAYVDHMLGSPAARVRAHLRPEAIDRLLAEHGRGTGHHGQVLWSLLMLEVFLRREDR
ncbi:MAG: asparagine synthase (glutamine-hydrolyzing) [Acidimicrobiia bacterium]